MTNQYFNILYFSGLAIVLSIGSCRPAPNDGFEKMICSPSPTPDFDGRKVTLLSDDGQPLRDTIMDQIKKYRTVFKPCRALVYQVRYYSAEGVLITDNTIQLTPFGQRWEMQPEIQDKIDIQYSFAEADIQRARPHRLNPDLDHGPWIRRTSTGVIENANKVWMHPFRSNQYVFTEVAPFPEVRLPLEVGRAWTGGLNIGEGWGAWSDSRGSWSYTVTAREDIDTPYGPLAQCWKIESKAVYPFGTSTLDFWFHEDLGFVRKDYVNYAGQRLEIVLSEVDDESS